MLKSLRGKKILTIIENIMKREIEVKAVKVSQKGQIAIPADTRKQIGVKKGDTLLLVRKGRRIMLEKQEELSEKLEEEFGDLLSLTESSLRALWMNKQDEIWNKYLKRGRRWSPKGT